MTDQSSMPQSEVVQSGAHAELVPAGGGTQRTVPPSERDDFFRKAYDEHFTYVWHSLRRFGVWDRELEDAAHDVFIVVHKKLDTYDADRPLKPWLLGIAFRVASDFRRRAQNKREIASDDFVAVDEQTKDQDHVLQQKEQQELVALALTDLDDDKRTVFVLHELEGHSVVDIAEMVQVPLNTCYSRLRLARERFAKAVHRIRDDATASAAARVAAGGTS